MSTLDTRKPKDEDIKKALNELISRMEADDAKHPERAPSVRVIL